MAKNEANRRTKMKAVEKAATIQEKNRIKIARQMVKRQFIFTNYKDNEYKHLPNRQRNKFDEEYIVLATQFATNERKKPEKQYFCNNQRFGEDNIDLKENSVEPFANIVFANSD